MAVRVAGSRYSGQGDRWSLSAPVPSNPQQSNPANGRFTESVLLSLMLFEAQQREEVAEFFDEGIGLDHS